MGGSSLATSGYVTSLSGHITADSLPTYVSTNNFIIVRFTSDKTVGKAGFKATFTTGETWLLNIDIYWLYFSQSLYVYFIVNRVDNRDYGCNLYMVLINVL